MPGLFTADEQGRDNDERDPDHAYSLYMLPAINMNLRPRNISRLVGAQKEQQIRHLMRLSEPLQRDLVLDDVFGAGERIEVSISPGATAFTRTPELPKSCASSRVSATSAAFDEA